MFKQLISNFIRQKELRKENARILRLKKYYEVRGALIKFFEDYDLASGDVVNIPAFQRADETLRTHIKDEKDLNFFYDKLVKYQQVA